MCNGNGTPGNSTTFGSGNTGMIEGKSIGCDKGDATLRTAAQGSAADDQEDDVREIARQVGALAALVAVAAGCTSSDPPSAVERGRRVYMANCIVCHNPDPAKPGSAGPEVAGASHELLEARVLHGTYPPGYTPKRATKAMVPLPHLASRLDDLTAFLAAAQGPAARQ